MVQNMSYQKQIDERIEGNRTSIAKDTHRLQYHLTPPVGLLNDPNGLIHFKGKYHVFFQWNPFETKHGKKSWGHYTSTDLIHWTLEKAALTPDSWYDKDGCYSGSAIEHEGRMYLFYTGNVKNEFDERSTYQCLAVSDDGMTFEKKGPVFNLPDGYTPHFRDPKVWKDGQEWLMVIGAQNSKEQGEAVLAKSSNLEDWKFAGPIAGSHMNGLGDFGYMWECPDLFHLDGKDILIVCPQGLGAEGDRYKNLYQAGYFVGTFDGEAIRYDHGSFSELDRGFDFYAPQTMVDGKGRRILFGWMGMTDDQEQNQPTIKQKWIHALTIPRVLKVKDEKIIQTPVPELEELRGTKIGHEVTLKDGEVFTETVFPSSEVTVNFDAPLIDGFELEIRKDIRLVFEKGRFIVERKSISGNGSERRAVALKYLNSLQIYLDHSSIEIFINEGEEVFTCRYFPDSENNVIRLKVEDAHSFDLCHWPLEKEGIIMF